MISEKTSLVQWHRITKRAEAVKQQRDQLRKDMDNLSPEQAAEALRKKTRCFRSHLAKHETTEDKLLPEAFAVVCIAFEKLWPYLKRSDSEEESGKGDRERDHKGVELNDRQIQGGIALYDGRIVEMKTGEGKTFTAALPLYLNALSGNGCVLVTTNEYLARRDAGELCPFYEALGLKAACGVPREGRQFTPEKKKEIYSADIVYSTQNVLTGDYLQENRRSAPEVSFFRKMNYCIVDEADAVLLDNASIPLIISGSPRDASRYVYAEKANDLVSQMKESARDGMDGDYIVDKEAVWLTEEGIRRTEESFEIGEGTLYAEENEAIVKAVTLALRAHTTLKRDKHYIVRDHRIVLLDVREGRPLPNNMLQSGQHQALEVREHVPISPQMRSLASITFQSFFNMYPRLAGMTGTGVPDEEEFRSIYGLEVVRIPTEKGVARVDEPIRIYPRHDAMIRAAMEDILATHRRGQPVLIVVSSIQISEEVDAKLLQERIPHNVLNAKNLAREAKIIQEAAQKGAVTVATAVAGRGTDIRLGGTDNNIYQKRPRKDDIEILKQHINTLEMQVTELHHKRNPLMKNPQALTEKLQDIQQLSRQVEEDVENLEEADVLQLGGLAVIGIGMMRNKRSELQARGRSGRKGDKGRSVFYVSLEDDVVTENSPGWLKRYADSLKKPGEPKPGGNDKEAPEGGASGVMLKGWFIRRAVEGTQKAAETKERELRRQMRSVEDSIRQQREIIYDLRNHVLEEKGPKDPGAQKQFCKQLADRVIEQYLTGYDRMIREKGPEQLKDDLEKFARDHFNTDASPVSDEEDITEKRQARAYLQRQAETAIEARFREMRAHRENEVDANRFQTEYLRAMKLKAIDEAWVEQVDFLQQLREIVSGRCVAGRNMQREFQREAHKAYDLMAEEIERETLRNILFGNVT